MKPKVTTHLVWIVLILVSLKITAPAQILFSNVTTTFIPGIDRGTVAWGDYDGDGRLDILLAGYPGLVQVLRNNGQGFEEVPISNLTTVHFGSAVWTDYDSDGRLDFMLVGEFFDDDFMSNEVTELWRNTGTTFVKVPIPGLPGLSKSSVAWGDYDNDGRQDFIITGSRDGGVANTTSQIWRNTGKGFSNVTASVAAGLPGTYISYASWVDFDNDGRLDFVLGGQVWRNVGGRFVDVYDPAFYTPHGPMVWGDYDNDGRMDFLAINEAQWGSNDSQLWRNTDSGFVDMKPTLAPDLPRIATAAVAWGDFDNDGRLDMVLTGRDGVIMESPGTFQIWRNTGSGFVKVPLPDLPGLEKSSVSCGDFDNDGRLDILASGYSAGVGRITQLWRNMTPKTNTPPTAPTGLAMTATTNAVMLSWNSATDEQTPAAGLTYNVRAGTTPGGNDLITGHATLPNGFRRLPTMGNAYLHHGIPLTGLTNGQKVYWSVQAIDTSFAGGPFATETSVVSLPKLAIGTNAVVTWFPPTFGWLLQETTNFQAGPWTTSPSGDLNPAVVYMTNGARFFRLTRP